MSDVAVINQTGISQPDVKVVAGVDIATRLTAWQTFATRCGEGSLNRDPRWLAVLAEGRGHTSFCVEAFQDDQLTGLMPLCLVTSPLFGRFLVSLPHLSSGGVCCANQAAAFTLVDRAIVLADELDVDFLELRSDRLLPHPQLQHVVTDKVHMRLELPSNRGQLWARVGAKIRNQVRKGEQFGFRASWGGVELLEEFYTLYARRMRDFGSPVDGKRLFEQILKHFPSQAELIVVRQDRQPVAAAMVLHGPGMSEMHRSASLNELRSTAVNTWLHWQVLSRTVERGNRHFDFGRPTVGTSVYTFKKRFDAVPCPAAIQHYLRRGSPAGLRRVDGKFKLRIKLWSCMPVRVTRWVGPLIARGLP
jgi:FemAB-related protein (PEP-CTERM system-associated)